MHTDRMTTPEITGGDVHASRARGARAPSPPTTRVDALPYVLVASAAVAAFSGLVNDGLYLGYTYAYYVLGNGFTDLLLLEVMVLTGSLVGLIRLLPGLMSSATPSTTPDTTRNRIPAGSRRATRGAAVTLGMLAVALGGMWVSVCLAYAATGAVPEGSLLVESDQVVQLGIVLDLVLLVPLYGAAATLLWRGRWAGVVLGAIALIAGLLHQLSYLAALVFQDIAGVPGSVGFDPIEPVIVAVYLTGTVLLFRGLAQAPSAAVEPRTG